MTHVVVSGWLLPTGESGANRRLLEVLRAAADQLGPNERVTLLCSARAPMPDLPTAIRCMPIDIPALPATSRALAERRHLRRALTDLGATVYEQGHIPLCGGLPCPVVLTIHDLRDLTEHRRRPRWLSKLALSRSLAHASYVAVPSQFTWRGLEAEFGKKVPTITVVPNGVSEAGFAKEPQVREEPCYLHVGRIEPRKNLMMLLSAYAQVVEAARDPDRVPPLVLAGGDGGEQKALKERAAFLEIAGRVQFLGQVDEARLLSLYHAAVCVLVPSWYEGFGMPVLEGMAAGKPVLVSDRGALPEVAGDAATVLPAGDPAAWAKAMANADRLSSDPFLAAARRRRVRELTWERTAASMLEIWHELSR